MQMCRFILPSYPEINNSDFFNFFFLFTLDVSLPHKPDTEPESLEQKWSYGGCKSGVGLSKQESFSPCLPLLIFVATLSLYPGSFFES